MRNELLASTMLTLEPERRAYLIRFAANVLARLAATDETITGGTLILPDNETLFIPVEAGHA